MGVEDVCLEHSGTCEAIKTLKKNDDDIFARLHALETTVWKASGVCSFTSGVIIVILEKVLR